MFDPLCIYFSIHYSFARKHDPDTLRETYLLVPPRDKVDGVIFVTSATSEVPKNLMNMVKEAAWPNKSSGNYKRRSKYYHNLNHFIFRTPFTNAQC